jgi:hypothetical protein
MRRVALVSIHNNSIGRDKPGLRATPAPGEEQATFLRRQTLATQDDVQGQEGCNAAARSGTLLIGEVSRHVVFRLLIAVAVAFCVLAVGVPIVVFGIVPVLVRSTIHEATPVPAVVAGPGVDPSAAPVSAPTATVVSAGMLRKISPVHFGSGQVSIIDLAGARYLRFEGVAIAGAPNMFVYLSDRGDGQPGNFTDLGPLKATDGSFNYPLPAGLDLAAIRSVVVWCRAFSITVTYAELARP